MSARSARTVGRPHRHGYGGGRGAQLRPKLRPPEHWEINILRLVSEQGAIPVDQLARFLDCEEARARRIAGQLGKAGFTSCREFLVDQPAWVWTTERGARISGTGLSPWTLNVGSLPRIRATNEVRLQVRSRAPNAVWISDRLLRRVNGREGRIPNGVVEIGEERHAIQIELAIKTKARAISIISAHHARYDAVVCFCNPQLRRLIERLARDHHWPKLIIRALPGA
jgi:hypothetical protein